MVGVRAEILQLETTTAPQLALQAGAPLIHASRWLVPGIRDDQAGRGRRRTDSGGERIGQGRRCESSGPSARKNRGVRRVRVQKCIAVGLVGGVIDAAPGP